MICCNIDSYHLVVIFAVLIVQPVMPYLRLSLDNDELCSYTTKREIVLGETASSGLIVSLSPSNKFSHHTANLIGDLNCKFRVSTSGIQNGLFAVAQNSMFYSNDSINNCDNYVEYKTPNTSLTKRFCTLLNMDVPQNNEPDLTPMLSSFIEPSGVLDVYIHISKKHLNLDDQLALEIVFTSYRYCYQNSSQEDKPCSKKYATHRIYKNFFNDGYVNCPYPGCVDETKCLVKVKIEDRSSYGIRVAISSVVVLLLITMVVAIYLCRKTKKLCWNEIHSNYQQPHVVEINETSVPQANAYIAISPSSSGQDELPPTYNSLFPDK